MFRQSLFAVFVVGKLIQIVYALCPAPDPLAPCFTQSDFDAAIIDARSQLEAMESTLQQNSNYPGFRLTPNEPAFTHFQTHDIDPAIIESNRIATYVNTALTALKGKFNLTKTQFKSCLKRQNISTSAFCVPKKVNCIPEQTSYYRTDAQCNNIANPLYGAKTTPIIRLFADGFADGISAIAANRSVDSARTDSVSANEVKGINQAKDPSVNSDMSTMLGQLLTHEFFKTKKCQFGTVGHIPGFNCCNMQNDTFLAQLIALNQYCYPIDVKATDTCFANQVRCLNYIKSLKSLNNCKLDETTMPINFHSPVFDCELIYNDLTLAHLARNGKFDVENFPLMRDMLVGYDDRSMQLPGLFIFLNFFTRLHNLVFDQLKIARITFSNAVLSLEARKITCAIYQKIFLDFLINILPDPQSTNLATLGKCYNASINPQVSLEYNIVLRVLHYFLREKVSTYDEGFFTKTNPLKGKRPVDIDIADAIDNLSLYTNNKCGITHGSLDVAWNLAGIGPNIHCKFFAPNKTSFGHDLRSFDYQTGRENGESSYTEILRKVYGINKCDNDMTKNDFIKHDSATREFLANRFKNKMSDISFSYGLDFEDKLGMIIGPTAAFVIGEQITRSVCGDRFWFENAAFFREDQKARIRKMSFFNLVCLINNCFGTRIQSEPFLSPGSDNMKQTCPPASVILSDLDLLNWF